MSKILLILSCLIGGSGLAYGAGGVTQNGLQTRLVPLQTSFAVGHPMKFRVDVINRGEKTITLKYTADDIQGDDFNITTAEGEAVDYTASGEYEAKDFTLKLAPGIWKTLIHERNLQADYSLRSHGKYTLQYVQKIWDHTSQQLPPSNTLDINVLSGKP